MSTEPRSKAVSRRSVMTGSAVMATALATSSTAEEESTRTNPILGHAIATIGVPDVHTAQAMYEQAIGLQEANKGKVSERVAESWGAPAMQGRPWVMLRCESKEMEFSNFSSTIRSHT